MIEKVKNFDFNSSNTEAVNELVNELVQLPVDELKECVNVIIDSIDYKFTADDSTEKLPESYEIVFSNTVIKKVLEDLLEEYEQKA